MSAGYSLQMPELRLNYYLIKSQFNMILMSRALLPVVWYNKDINSLPWDSWIIMFKSKKQLKLDCIFIKTKQPDSIRIKMF